MALLEIDGTVLLDVEAENFAEAYNKMIDFVNKIDKGGLEITELDISLDKIVEDCGRYGAKVPFGGLLKVPDDNEYISLLEKNKDDLSIGDFGRRSNFDIKQFPFRDFDKKYIILSNDIEYVPKYKIKVEDNKKIYRLIAQKDFSTVKKGDLGGMINKNVYLSNSDSCWLDNNSVAIGNIFIWDRAYISNSSLLADSNTRIVIAESSRLIKSDIVGNVSIRGKSKVKKSKIINCYIDNSKIFDVKNLEKVMVLRESITSQKMADIFMNRIENKIQ